jgi:hypothetical protein
MPVRMFCVRHVRVDSGLTSNRSPLDPTALRLSTLSASQRRWEKGYIQIYGKGLNNVLTLFWVVSPFEI